MFHLLSDWPPDNVGTPLTLIQGPLHDAISNLGDSKAKNSLKMAARNVMRLSRLVDSLMDFSKLAANKLEGVFCIVGIDWK